jgi:hypothetical protein
VETNILKFDIPTMSVDKDRKMVWNMLRNPVQQVSKGVATTYFHGNYPGTWTNESQMILESPKPTDGNKYTQNENSNHDCGLRYKDGLELVEESCSIGVQGGCHNLFACQLSGKVIHGFTKDLAMAKTD